MLWGSGLRVLRFRVEGSGVQGLGVLGSGSRVLLGFSDKGFGGFRA